MDVETSTEPSSSLSAPVRVALIATVVAVLVAAYWFVPQRGTEVGDLAYGDRPDSGAQAPGELESGRAEERNVERIVRMTESQARVPVESDTEGPASAESQASALAAAQKPADGNGAGRTLAAIEEVTLDIGEGQVARLTSGSAGTLAIRELSAVDGGVSEVLGGRITLVSLNEPAMLMLDSGERFAPGARMPSGHVIAAIEHEQIVLELDGVVSVIRLP